MVMIVGLKSGRDFVVRDKFYIFGNNETGLLTHVFVSENGKRLITVPPTGSIEFTDEPATEDSIENLEQALTPVPTQPEKVECDPNVG